MNDITCRAMAAEDLHIHMMDSFDRHQEITHILRKNGRVKKLRKPRVEDWPAGGKTNFVKNWFIPDVYKRQYFGGEPKLFAAFRGDQVVAFANWRFMGKDHVYLKAKKGRDGDYAMLDRLFVSRDCRRMGLGRQLFHLCAEAARAEGAHMMYISTEPAVETQAFYRSVGCVKSKVDLGRVTRSPKHDIPLEYSLA